MDLFCLLPFIGTLLTKFVFVQSLYTVIALCRGIDLARWRELREERGEAADLEKFVQHVHGNHFIPNTALVDCTADSVIAGYYYEWLRKGIHVVTPNKKANSGPLDQVKNCTLSFGWVASIIDLSRVTDAIGF